MSLEFTTTSITTLAVNALVIPCSPHPIISNGINDDIYQVAGNALLIARRKAGAIPFGHAKITPAFQHPADFIIHAAVPPYQADADDTLLQLYNAIFHIAKEHRIKTIALPLLGYYSQAYPYEVARNILNRAIAQSDTAAELTIKLIIATPRSHTSFPDLYHYVTSHFAAKPSSRTDSSYRVHESDSTFPYQARSRLNQELTAQLSKRESGFSPTLLSLIAQRNEKESTIYKKANIDRKLFSKIRTNPNHQPTKSTVLAFAIALELTLDETNAFLRTAGYTLTRTSKTDIIVEYFLQKKIYDIFTINEALFFFGEPSLGSN